MKKPRAILQVVHLLAGLLLGVAAPALGLLLRMAVGGAPTFKWIRGEWTEHGFLYAYMGFCFPLAYGLTRFLTIRENERLVSERNLLKAEMTVLQNQSMTDDVTGLYNHRHLYEEIEKEIERSKRRGRSICGIMVDIDDFKHVNDTSGHLVGDRVLREAAFVLNQSIRKIDILGRYGGDEFLIILPETPYESAKIVADRIRENLRRHPFNASHDQVSLTASVGLLMFEHADKLDPAAFVQKVDEAMFRAKGLGKDRVFSGYVATDPRQGTEPAIHDT